MKGFAICLMFTALCVFASGCVTNMFPGGPTPAGVISTDVKVPAQNLTVATDATAGSSKVGEASASAILGLVAAGDASIDAAMKAGGIRKVHHVDHQVISFLFGAWLQDTTIVYGE